MPEDSDIPNKPPNILLVVIISAALGFAAGYYTCTALEGDPPPDAQNTAIPVDD